MSGCLDMVALYIVLLLFFMLGLAAAEEQGEIMREVRIREAVDVELERRRREKGSG